MEERTYPSQPAPARSVSLTPLSTLLESRRGTLLPLPRRLARLYGRLRMPMLRSRPHIFSNFVSTLDGVVSLGVTGHAGGGDISGFSAQDRMVMGLLRAIADVVIIGSGTLGVDNQDVWTAEAIFPALADDFRELRERLGKTGPLMNVIVSGNGAIDLRLPIFTSGKVPVLIVTTTKGASKLTVQNFPDSVQFSVIDTRADKIPARTIFDAVTT